MAATTKIRAACIEGDFRSRLRHKPAGGSERFHAVADHGGFACDRHNMSPGAMSAATEVPEALRCRRAACAERFRQADSDEQGPKKRPVPPARMGTRAREAASPWNGGAGAVESFVRRSAGLPLGQAACEELWQQCRKHMLSGRHPEQDVVDEIEGSANGRLGTYPRGGLADAIAMVLTGMPWPVNATPENDARGFAARLAEEMCGRGYAA